MRASTARCGLLWHAWTLVGEAEADNHCKVAVVSQRLSLNRLASIKAGCQLKYPVWMSMEQRPPDWFPFAPLCSTVLHCAPRRSQLAFLAFVRWTPSPLWALKELIPWLGVEWSILIILTSNAATLCWRNPLDASYVSQNVLCMCSLQIHWQRSNSTSVMKVVGKLHTHHFSTS